MKKTKWIWLGSVLILFFVVAGIGEVVYRASLDFPLYKNEAYWGGSKQTELLSFVAGARRVVAAQEKLKKRNNDRPTRVFHTKQLGCLTGKLILRHERPGDPNHETFKGLFDPSRKDTYDVVMRFSNGLGMVNPDREADVKGAAIKIFDVENGETKGKQTVDFLMTNFPTAFGKDFLEFASFMDKVANYPPVLGTSLFSTAHPRAGLAILQAAGFFDYKFLSVATLRYWSGHPYLLGTDRAMKFSIIPTETKTFSREVVKTWGDNYLRRDLSLRLSKDAIHFTFAVQLEKDPALTPIEDNLHEWKETDSPFIPVADLILDKQNFDKPEIDAQCDALRFTPGHFLPEHRPLSNMGRGRLFGYEASQIGRGSPQTEPNEDLVKGWRTLNQVR